jgi:hypothetical protein
MLLYLSTAHALELSAWIADASNVFVARVDAIDFRTTEEGYPYTVYGFRILRELMGDVRSHEVAFAYQEELLFFASEGLAGRWEGPALAPRALSRLPLLDGTMAAFGVGTGSWERYPTSLRCAQGRIESIRDVEEDAPPPAFDAPFNEASPSLACRWEVFLESVAAQTRGKVGATLPGDTPLPDGAESVTGTPVSSIHDFLRGKR